MLEIKDELEEYPAIIEEASWGFRLWIVTAVFRGIRDGFVVQNDNGDDRVVYEDEVSFIAKQTAEFRYYAYTEQMAKALGRGFEKWQAEK